MLKRNFKSKIVLSLLLVVMMLLSVGCSQNEFTYLTYYKEMMNMENSESSGILEFSITGSDLKDSLDISDEEYQKLAGVFSSIKLKYNMKQSLNPIQAQGNIEYSLLGKEFKPLTSLIMKNDIIYFKTSDLKYIISDIQEITGENIDQEEIDKFLENDYVAINSSDVNNGVSTEQSLELSNSLMNILITKMSTNGSLDLVSKDGNRLTIELNEKNSVDLIVNFLGYLLDNLEVLENEILPIMVPLVKEEMKKSGLAGGQDLDLMINQMLTELNNNKEEMKQQLTLSSADIKNTIASHVRFNIKNSLEKLSSGEFESSTEIDISPIALDINIKMKIVESIKTSSKLNVIAPTEGVVNIEDLIDLGPSFNLEKSLSINIDTGEVFYLNSNGSLEQDRLELFVQEGRTYLPLRSIGEILGEDVTWDPSEGVAFIMTNTGEKVILAGINVEGVLFVKVRDFEKVGLEVQFEEEFRLVTISK